MAPKIATLRSALDWRPPGPPSLSRRSVILGMNKSGLSSPGVAEVLLVDVKARLDERAETDRRCARRAAEAVRPNMMTTVAILIHSSFLQTKVWLLNAKEHY